MRAARSATDLLNPDDPPDPESFALQRSRPRASASDLVSGRTGCPTNPIDLDPIMGSSGDLASPLGLGVGSGMSGQSVEPFREIGRRLAAIRAEAGLTQRQLVARIHRDQSWLAKLELAERRLDINDLVVLAGGLELSPAALLHMLIPELGDL